MSLWENLKTGNVERIIDLIKNSGVPFQVISYEGASGHPYKEVRFATDVSEVEALRAECKVERDRVRKFGGRAADDILCRYQVREHGLGARSYHLSRNIYGYCVGDQMASNIAGGRFSCTPRGYSLEQAIEWGINVARRKNVSFEVSLDELPAEVQAALNIQA